MGLRFAKSALVQQPVLDSSRFSTAAGSRLEHICRVHIVRMFCLICESGMAQITALELQKNFGEVQHQARRGPVEITDHGRRELVLMSADHYDWLKAAARRTVRQAG